MKKGDLVVMSRKGKLTWLNAPANPHDEIGVLHSIYGSGNCQVTWRACTNSYGKGDIVGIVDQKELIEPIQPGPVRCGLAFVVEE